MNYSVIIAELNPPTFGHQYLINKTKEMFPNNGIIVLTSGNYVQRGEPSIINKHTKAQIALNMGVDAVIELPLIFSLSSAQDFSFGAIKCVSGLNNVVRIVFGSECGDINLLKEKASVEPNSTEIKTLLKEGKSVATSLIAGDEILSKPNNLLGVEYLRAINKLNLNIDVVTIKRTNEYNDLEVSDTPSASAIRNEIYNIGYEKASRLIPFGNIIDPLTPIPNKDLLYSLICFKVITCGNELKNTNGVTEGLDQRIISTIKTSSTFDDLVEKVSTKRYPKNKIKRILLNFLFCINKPLVSEIKQDVPYLKLIGVNAQTKSQILRDLSESKIKIITKHKDTEKLSNLGKTLDHLDEVSDLIYSQLTTKDLSASSYSKKI